MTPPLNRPGNPSRKPFRGSDAIASGILTKGRLGGSGWRRLFRDVYVNSSVPVTHLLRMEGAALLLKPGAAFSGRSAALLWGAKMGDIDDDVEVRSIASAAISNRRGRHSSLVSTLPGRRSRSPSNTTASGTATVTS